MIEVSEDVTLYTLAEAARAIGKSERTIREWRRTGRVTFVRGYVSRGELARGERAARRAVGGRPVRAS